MEAQREEKKLEWKFSKPLPGEFLCQVCMERDATHEVKFMFSNHVFHPKVCDKCIKLDLQTIIKEIKG